MAPHPGATTHLIGCTLPEVFSRARPGDRVWLDDGKIGGFDDYVVDDRLELIVSDIPPGRLRAWDHAVSQVDRAGGEG